MSEATFDEGAIYQAAARYAEREWRVIPLHSVVDGVCTCRKRATCLHPGKHPHCSHGVNDATADLSVIRGWWKQWPDANVGIATGEASGFDVVDIDPRDAGDESLRSLELKHGELPATVMSITSGKGYHYCFRHDPGLQRNAVSIMPGIDIRTSGGYIVAPPSLHSSGLVYCWEGASHPDEVEIADWPAWLASLVGSCVPKASLALETTKPILKGTRNNTLTRFAGAMRGIGMEAPEIAAALDVRNRLRCVEPLLTEEINKIAKSVVRYAPNSNGKQRGKFIPPGYKDMESAWLDLVRFGPDLGPSQFIMLLFHAERLLGYRKQSDASALTQIVNGIYSERLGRRVRAGSGLKTSAAIKANRGLANRNPPLLLATPHSSPQKGHEPTEYEIIWPAWADYVAERKQQSHAPLVRKL